MSFENEKIIETKACQKCQTSFDVTDKDLEFYDKVSPVFPSPDSVESGLKKYSIPTPKLCPRCRQQRRLTWRNERNLYKRKCDFSGKEIVSMFRPDSRLKVFDHSLWRGDEWDPLEYGREFNEKKGFFEQFSNLHDTVPHFSLFMSGESESSPYINCAGGKSGVKNCYLVFNTGDCEDCAYLNGSRDCTDCYDNNFSIGNTNCYEVVNCSESHNLSYSIDSHQSSHSMLLKNCIGCSHCIGCINLQNKKYCYFNEQLSKEEFEKKFAEIQDSRNMKEIQKKFLESWSEHPSKQHNNIACSNVEGDYIENSSNCLSCFDVSKCEDIKYCCAVKSINHAMDSYGFGFGSELLYENMGSGGNAYQLVSTLCCETCTHSYYCVECRDCSDCFGCVGLKNKQYCILNKQYSKEEYNTLVPKIIEKMRQDGEWGEFFPSGFSPFGYNETVANEYFSLNKSEAQKQGFNWSDYKAPLPKVEKTIPANKLPENIKDIPNDILNWAIECESTRKPFKLIPQELEFYRQHNIPVPKKHPDQRHFDRIALRNPRELFERDCDKCSKQIQTTYSPERPETVYCEECYNQEIY